MIILKKLIILCLLVLVCFIFSIGVINFNSRFNDISSENNLNDKNPTIIIDAGHGGDSDRGTSWAGLKEKDANLAIARYLREILADMGYEICMIREDDTGVELQDRPAYAMANGADLYIR